MDKGDIWLPEKIDTMPGKTPGAEADKGNINTRLQFGHSGHWNQQHQCFGSPARWIA